ncbi:ABC transporter ATP-binding protein [Pleionea litopenaei]|uniref:ABC transporter ATP-binding protein n=1 Tax=Pleionea litopenaei TaxID=3070815 RepID=A0AA51RRA1_9GAMM|nr:ABC transporter ATP-binding protein [Pleionea sp. HL-JVS1]WMS86083.1 ABC transporter ATP-binding protein [Pleionea sp. HL-JVS1]
MAVEHPVYTAQHLSWQVQDKLILNDLSFAIGQGEFVGLIGPNGAGKSSLLRCLYRKITPTRGTLAFQQKSLAEYSRQQLAQKVAVVLQEPPNQFELTVFDVIAMGLTPHKGLLDFDTSDDRDRVVKACKQVDLNDKLEQNFNSLSGGEKQRAMIARAIVQQPQVLLMDEPTNHLDIRHQLEVLHLARSLKITVIVSIHDLNLAAAFCDRLILLDHGRIVADGDKQQVLCEKHIADVFGVSSAVDSHPFHDGQRITFNLAKPS